MSVQRTYPIRCPNCGHEFEASLHDSLTLTVDGEERAPEDVYTKVAPGMDEEVEAELEALGD